MTATHPTPELSGAVRNLLRKLAWRDDMGTCYLVDGQAGREVLVAPVMRRGGSLTRLSAYARSTVAHAVGLDLVHIGTSEASTTVVFENRQRDDGDTGRAITLTAAGWQALGYEDGRNPFTKAKEAHT